MAIEKNAVREGTRWSLFGRTVEVAEVTSRSVIYGSTVEGERDERVIPLDEFLRDARDPQTAEHEHLFDVFGSWMKGMQPVEPEKVSQAISYILVRLGPPAPHNVAPSKPAEPAKPVYGTQMPVFEPGGIMLCDAQRFAGVHAADITQRA